MMGKASEEVKPKRERTPGRVYAWRERSWCRPRKQRKRGSSHQKGSAPVWRERSESFSKSPDEGSEEREASPTLTGVKMLPGEEIHPSLVHEVELVPSPQIQALRSCRPDVSDTVCRLCGGVRLCGAALEELEDEVDRILAESDHHADDHHAPQLRRMEWSQIWPGNPYWQ